MLMDKQEIRLNQAFSKLKYFVDVTAPCVSHIYNSNNASES